MVETNKKIENVLHEARQLDEKALDVLVTEYYSKIYNFYYYRTKTVEDAEDLTNEVFIRMVRKMQTQTGDFSSWIYRIARNLLVDHYREKGKMKTASIEHMNEDLLKSSGKERHERLVPDDIKELFAFLTEEQRDVMTLKFIEGRTNEEISRIVDKSVGAVKLLQFRALSALRKIFNKVME